MVRLVWVFWRICLCIFVTRHKENLTEKTKRSSFAARRYLDFLKLPIHIINKLFNTLFFPILTYCSEVWGIYDKSDYSRWDKDSIEKTHIHFCKMCLGLNKRSPNVASRNELGRLSLNLQITMNIFKFWIHLENQPPDSIAKLCLNISEGVHLSQMSVIYFFLGFSTCPYYRNVRYSGCGCPQDES